MYFDGQNLEAETEQEAGKLIDAIKSRFGEIEIVENVDCHMLKASNFTFIVQEGNSRFITMTGVDDESDAVLYDLFADCGGRQEDMD